MTAPAARLRSLAAALALTALASSSAGCSWLPFRPSGPDRPGAGAAEDGADAAGSAQDSTAAGRSASPPESTVAAAETGSANVPDPAAPVAPRTTPPVEPPPPAPDPSASDQVTVQLSDAERADLENRARESLREARRVIRTIDRTTLSAESLEKLAAAESLVDQARAAFDDDVRAAATLAHKASVLLEELTAK